MEAVFVEDWEIYTKQVTDNLITQRLQKNSKEKLATVATDRGFNEIWKKPFLKNKKIKTI